ncbi:HdeD family acid-resistance protein [Methylosinus sp. Sm6]|uniref:HdeD family acid-resistance protein n=1 Tax=Methylosinus sp. Sm6 TaxID=2866948 RepID=UPI001C99BE5C|nr:HdeD family acid-resistance protein [Methylosinus sp. Sm6]MBY6240882.1 HdeD family acid-resistance protein [Methylosinus sp. Sm6]
MSTSSISDQPFPGGPFGVDRLTAKNAILARNWWAVALRGLAAIIFGLIALFMPGVTILSLVLVFAAFAIVDGVATMVSAARAARRGEAWLFMFLAGLVKIAAGLFAAFWPGITALIFVLLFGIEEIIAGGLFLGSAFELREDHGRWLLALTGILSILFGLFVALSPVIGAVVLAWWIGAYAIAIGIVELMLAFRLRARHVAGGPLATPQGA